MTTTTLSAARPGMLAVEKARALLASATRTDEVKKIRNVAVAMKAYARTQEAGQAIAVDAGEIILRADVRLGELARDLPKAAGPGRGNKTSPNAGLLSGSKHEALDDVGISRQRAAEFEKVAKLPPALLDRYIAAERQAGRAPSTSSALALARMAPGARSSVVAKLGDLPDFRRAMNAVRRDERIEKIAEQSRGNSPLTGALGRFPVLYVDPPWPYEHVKTESRAVENQYPTMPLDDIRALRVKEIATPDAVLFCWATSPKLAEALQIVDDWGFSYRTNLVWVKDRIGMGYYARQKHEILLIATIGQPPVPPEDARPASVVEAPRGEHSRKPAIFYDLIERMYPAFQKIELFARAPRQGWAAWGNES